MRAVALVAHPDDCVIFARPFINAHPHLNWSIVYLTYSPHELRAVEIANYWSKQNIPTTFLGFIDTYGDSVNNRLSFSEERATQKVKEAVVADLILTHSKDGDYGHIHHKLLYSIANQINVPKVYFARTSEFNLQFQTTLPNLDELPIHRAAIEQCPEIQFGRYLVVAKYKEMYYNNFSRNFSENKN